VEVLAEGTSLIAVARIGGHGAVCGLEIIVATRGEKTVIAQCWYLSVNLLSISNNVQHSS